MTSIGPWSVKGIDPKAREVAKDLARRSGMTLGEWLNQMIIDGEAEAPPVEVETRRPAYRDLGAPGEPFRAPSGRSTDTGRIAQALDQLSERLDAAEQRSTLAISGVDQSVRGVLARLDGLERDHHAAAVRVEAGFDELRHARHQTDEAIQRLEEQEGPRAHAFEALQGGLHRLEGAVEALDERTRAGLQALEDRASGALQDVREDLSNTARRLDRTEAKVERLLEAQPGAAAIEDAVARISERLEQADDRTTQAVRGLEASFAGLDARLQLDDGGSAASEAMERRLQMLAAELTHKFEAARSELADQLRAAADGHADQMESKIAVLSAKVESDEHRSAEAIERMGREVLRVASALGDRVGRVEELSTQAARQVGGEIARMADVMEQRIGRQDSAQAQALEKLGGEISRIAEKLAERILSAERRSAQAIDDVGDQLGRVTERLNQRYDRAQSELGERIRQSEERTAKLLEEAQARVEDRLTEAQRRAAQEAAAEAARKAAAAEIVNSAPAADEEDSLHSDFLEADVDEPFAADPFAVSLSPFEDEGALFQPAPEPPLALSHEDVAGLDPFDEPAPRGEPEIRSAALSTREMLEQARAAARQASEHGEPKGRRGPPAAGVEAPSFEGPSGGFSFGFPRRKKKEGVTIGTALLASGTAAALAITGAGALLLVNSEMGGGQDRQADHFGVAPTAASQGEGAAPGVPPSAAEEHAPAAPPAADQAAVALSQTAPASPAAASPALGSSPPGSVLQDPAAVGERDPAPVAPAPSADAQMLYSAAVRRIEGHDFGGLEDLKRSANLGDPAAEFYLAKLYETGGAGLGRDLVTARRWTERAAMGGDAAAMHNLGLYFYEGEGGPQDSAQAARWFRRAADLGVRDSQYNLALLYAKGYGVPQNAAEAYKWYLIAAAEGDDGAKKAAAAIRLQLTPEAEAAAERTAAAFRSQTQASIRPTLAAPATP